jgi:DNA-directed RNA polymerase subunit E'/Rpb7
MKKKPDGCGTLNLLPIGEGTIYKKNKYGVWVDIGGNRIFIHFSDTFTDPDTWEELPEYPENRP